MVDFLLYAASLEASVATRSKISTCNQMAQSKSVRHGHVPLTNEFKIDMARLEIPVSGWTCFSTIDTSANLTRR